MLQNSNQEQSASTSRWTPWQEGIAELFIALIFLMMGIASLLESALRKQR